MNKYLKYHKSIVPGKSNSTNVVNRDINFAIRNWKKHVKTSGILDILKQKQEFEKSSITKQKILSSAKYKQKLRSLDDQY